MICFGVDNVNGVIVSVFFIVVVVVVFMIVSFIINFF